MTASCSALSPRKPLPSLAIVVPCYNEEDVLPETTDRLLQLLLELQTANLIDQGSAIVLVDDGSSDRTWAIVDALARTNRSCTGIKLARNVGHQNALLSGLLQAKGDVIITLDADLQDDVRVIPAMLVAHREGADIVFAVRRSRGVDTFSKRATAELYYRLLRLLGVDIVFNHADYRLMSRRAVEALRHFPEVNLFLRGIIPLLGFPTRTVAYDRQARFAGRSKYPLRKMFALALDGITSFTTMPLRWITISGIALSLVSFLVGLWALMVRLFTSRYLPGWASTVVPISFISGIQLLSLGLIGEYLGKVYVETKRRPRFIVERTTEHPGESSYSAESVNSRSGGDLGAPH